MPKCVVRKCPHQTGKKFIYPNIVLHPFPKNIKLIQDWLRLAGMQEENLELVSSQILEDKRSDKFRMCSAHFTQDCYGLKGSKRVLKRDARPSKFPELSVLDFAHPPMMHRIAQQAQMGKKQVISTDGRPATAKCNCKCHTQLKAKLVNSSTQTEPSDLLIVSDDPYMKLASQQHVGMDHGYSQGLTQAQSAADKAMAVVNPVKKWERTDFHLQQEKNPNENGFLSSKDAISVVEYSTQDEKMTAGEESSFEIITVQDWDTDEVQIKQEDQGEKDVLRLGETEKGRYTNDVPSSHAASNQKRGDQATEIKKAFIDDGTSPSEKPIRKRAVPSIGQNPIKKKKRDTVKEQGQCRQSTSSHIEHSVEDASDATKPKRNEDASLPDPSKSLSDGEGTVPSTLPLSLQEQYAKEKKFVVFESCLDVLLLNMRCQKKYCSERIKRYHKHTVGSLLVVYATCCKDHHFKLWESQPRVNGLGAGNVLLATLLVLTGSSFSTIKELCDIIGLQIFSESSFHRYENKYIFPSIEQFIQEEDESEILCRIKEEDAVLDRRRSR